MIPPAEQLAFAGVTLVMAATPGPNMVYLVSRSLCQGRRAGLVSLAGVLAGFLLHALATAAGLTALFAAVPLAYEALRWAGVAYLLHLAWSAARRGGRPLFEPRALPAASDGRLLFMGFATNALNPKVALFYLAVIPQFISPSHGSLLAQSLNLAAIQMLASLGVNVFVVLFAARLGRHFAGRPGRMAAPRYLMCAVLVGLACRMAVEPRRGLG